MIRQEIPLEKTHLVETTTSEQMARDQGYRYFFARYWKDGSGQVFTYWDLRQRPRATISDMLIQGSLEELLPDEQDLYLV